MVYAWVAVISGSADRRIRAVDRGVNSGADPPNHVICGSAECRRKWRIRVPDGYKGYKYLADPSNGSTETAHPPSLAVNGGSAN